MRMWQAKIKNCYKVHSTARGSQVHPFVACDVGLTVFRAHGSAACCATLCNLFILGCLTQEAPFPLLQGDPCLQGST